MPALENILPPLLISVGGALIVHGVIWMVRWWKRRGEENSPTDGSSSRTREWTLKVTQKVSNK